jgi:hypothetical protein
MTDNKETEYSQTLNEENLITSNSDKIKNKNNQTDKIKWSIFTEAETKIAAQKASKKAGLKLNEWIDYTLREAAITQLTKKIEPPAKTEDVMMDIVGKFAERMKADQAETLKIQNDLIQQQGQQIEDLTKAIANQPASLKEWLLGKPKKS